MKNLGQPMLHEGNTQIRDCKEILYTIENGGYLLESRLSQRW